MTAMTSWSHSLLLGLLPFAADPVPAAEDVRPGWIAFVVVMSLIAASVWLWFSMRKQLGRIQVPREGAETAARDTPVDRAPDTAPDTAQDAADGNGRPTDPRT